jgi:hypothetical protein
MSSVRALIVTVAVVAGTLLLATLRALAIDEVRGRVQRRVAAHVERTIAGLPEYLQDEWADEWRSELAAVISMPLTAARLSRGLRETAAQMVGEPVVLLSPVARAGDGKHRIGLPLSTWSARRTPRRDLLRRLWAVIRPVGTRLFRVVMWYFAIALPIAVALQDALATSHAFAIDVGGWTAISWGSFVLLRRLRRS